MHKFLTWGSLRFAASVLAFYLIIRVFLFQAFHIPSESMLGTLLVGDFVIALKSAYGVRVPYTGSRLLPMAVLQRGDVVVFESPEDYRLTYVKRVVALPGETVSLRNKILYVNGKEVRFGPENYRDAKVIPQEAGPRDNMKPYRVPKNACFVMGDNRDFSSDSRFWGPLTQDKILGLVVFKFWSWDKERLTPRFSEIGKPVKRLPGVMGQAIHKEYM